MKKRWYFIIVICISIIIDAVVLFYIYQPKFKDLTIEVGSKELDLNLFVSSKLYLKKSKCLTDIEEIDLNKTGEYKIEFSYGERIEVVLLNIIDSTAPKVIFKNITRSSDYKIDLNDFIESIEDYSTYEIITDSDIGNLSFGEHKINVIVKDKYGNETSKECILNIAFIYEEVHHELGTNLLISEILLNPEKDGNALSSEDLKVIDVNKEGIYPLDVEYNGKKFSTKIIVKDTLPPELEVKDVTVYQGDKSITNKSFVKSVKDNSNKVELTYLNEIDYEKLGTQEIRIVATDLYGNKTEKIAKYTLKKDNSGPVFKGLYDITVDKNGKIDYQKGVSAIDSIDGNCEFTIDTSKVDLSKLGTYYAKYTSIDKEGNITTKNRKIVVTPSKEDVDALFREYYNKYLKGKTVLEMTKYISSTVRYSKSFGEPDSVYYVLMNKSGNCYAHAIFLKRALDEAGIKNILIHANGEKHYWNLVYQDGKWRHYDSTPKQEPGPCTDAEKIKTRYMRGLNWDRSAYPKAE